MTIVYPSSNFGYIFTDHPALSFINIFTNLPDFYYEIFSSLIHGNNIGTKPI